MNIPAVKSEMAECAELIELNNHTEGYILGCKILLKLTTESVYGCNELNYTIDKLNAVKYRHDRRGYLDTNDSAERNRLYVKMMTFAKYTFSKHPKLYDEFYMSF